MSDTMPTSKKTILSIATSHSSEGTTLFVTFSGKMTENLGLTASLLREVSRLMDAMDSLSIENGLSTRI